MAAETTMRLQGKTILITARGQGIGRAGALACHRAGVRDGAAIDALARELPPPDSLFNCAGYVFVTGQALLVDGGVTI